MKNIPIGTQIGTWTVEKKLPGQKYACRCACKIEQSIRAYDLLNGKSLMCRQCSVSLASKSGRNIEEDGTYNTWVHMIQRCTNPNSKDYKNYGARGITVCDLWLDSYDAFLLQMGQRPDGYTIERIDYNKGYEPGNCKWLPRAEQPLNKRDNVVLTIFEETKVASQWIRDPRCVVNQNTFYKRIASGWDPERALTEAVHD